MSRCRWKSVSPDSCPVVMDEFAHTPLNVAVTSFANSQTHFQCTLVMEDPAGTHQQADLFLVLHSSADSFAVISGIMDRPMSAVCWKRELSSENK